MTLVRNGGGSKAPWVSLASMALFLIVFVILIVLTDADHRPQEILPLIGILLLGVQQGATALFAERNHQQLSNGFMDQKMVDAGRQAIREEAVVTRVDPATTAEIEALQQILIEIRTHRAETGRLTEEVSSPPRDVT